MEPAMTKKRSTNPELEEALMRARSVTVGTAFGGITELTMRRGDGSFTFAILQPVEVIELIHQLAANVGCHINLAPRRDFAAWRDWKYTEAELAHYRGVQHLPGVGHPPHPNDMAPHQQIGANMPNPESQPGVPLNLEGQVYGEAVAVEALERRSHSDGTAEAS